MLAEKERQRLRETIDGMRPPTGGIIIRTLAEGLTKKQLKADVGYLVKTWEQTQKNITSKKKPPFLVHEEPDIVLRSARDMFDDDVATMVVDDVREHKRLKEFVELFLPERAEDVKLYEGREPLFDEYGIEDEISRALGYLAPRAA